MAKHKNRNDAVGNNCIYQIMLPKWLYKFGKADEDRRTKSSGDPTRIHQQKKKLEKKYGEGKVFHRILFRLPNSTTKEAKEVEKRILQNYFDQIGEVPEGNRKSFTPRQQKNDN